MLKTIFGEAINIKYIELIKVDLQNKIYKQHKDNRDLEEDPMTGSQFREKQYDGDRVIDNLVPLKLESGQPTQGLTQGLKGPHGELLSSESFQQSSKKDALLVTNFKKEDKKGLKCSISGCDFTTSATKKAKKQIRKHEEKHRKEETIIAENTNTIDNQATRMSDSQMADDGSLLDDTGEGGHILSWGWPGNHKTTCALCGTSFPTIDLME